MADLLSELVGSPDYAEIERGNAVATADAIALLHGRLLDEVQRREAAIQEALPDLDDQEWIQFIGGRI